MKKELPINYQPSTTEVERYIVIWNKDEWSFHSENGLKRLFEKVYPSNDNLEGVIIKCAALNYIYYTNIFDVYSMAKHIFKLNIDERLNREDLTLVNDIAHAKIGGESLFFYSFATKYCSHHRPETYPIYDRYVHNVLCCLQKRDKFSNFKDQDLRNYDIFVKAIQDFQKKYNLQHYSFKQLDQYLWRLGKEYYGLNAQERK